jgi:hypothetical protein
MEDNPIEIHDDLIHLNDVTRVEVIDEKGRSYIKWDNDYLVKLSLQDDGKTLKIFLIKK